MKIKLGGNEALEGQAEAWEKFAKVVRKQSKRDTNMFDSKMDLPDAVDKSNLAKVVFLLGVNGADPNMKDDKDEPVITGLIHKIIVQVRYISISL